jgi:hypothetical protein
MADKVTTKQYRIRPGERFVMDKGVIKLGGEVIELEADVAAHHVGRIDEVPPPETPIEAQAE